MKKVAAPMLAKVIPAVTKFIKTHPKTTAAGLMGIGSGVGYYGTPNFFGYADDEDARRLGAAVSMLSYPFIPALTKRIGGVSTVGAMAVSELLPRAVKMMNTSQAAINNLAAAIAGQKPGVTQVTDLISKYSPELRGAGMGTALAGIGALGTSSLRRQTDREKHDKATRPDMAKSDFLKYLIPAMAAGGISGHMLANRK